MSGLGKIFNKLVRDVRKVPSTQLLSWVLLPMIITLIGYTYFVITHPDKSGISSGAVNIRNLIFINIALLAVIGVVVLRKLLHLWFAREKGRAGSRLLMKLVIMASLVSIIPAAVVGISSSFYLNLSIKSWFDDRVSNAVNESVKVADAYLKEHTENIRAEVVTMAGQINSNISFAFDNAMLTKFLTDEATRRLLSEAVVFYADSKIGPDRSSSDWNKKVVANAQGGLGIDPLDKVTATTLEGADKGQVVLVSGDDNKVTAIVHLRGNYYLLVSRFIDDKVLEHTRQARTAKNEYDALKGQIADFQSNSSIFFILIAIFLLFGALWMAFRFANNLVAPVTSLVSATDRVKRGEFTVRVKEVRQNDEIGVLSRSFNQMAGELEQQKRSLILAKREAEERTAFTEAVLSDLSSGVMAIDEDKRITLLNRSAREILDLSANPVGRFLKEAVPEFSEALSEAEEKKQPSFEKQVSLRRKTKRMNFIVRISPQTAKNVEGYILTFDDITELVSAQRMAAWSDVARKIAHEIKNPLTPINLSAQRLAKKYLKLMPEDEKENFEGYTNTISRHTADIANIIQEFSNFAKMPAPKFARVNISEILKDAVFSARVRRGKIEFTLDMPDEMETIADGSQISQVLTNVIKNASEAVHENRKEGGQIKTVATIGENIIITIDDNGKGFPEELMDRLTEPYVTTREKGTGLGLAIVKKIMQDHNGKIELTNIKGGARVVLTLPIL